MITYDDLIHYLRGFASRFTDMDEVEAEIAIEEFLEEEDIGDGVVTVEIED